MFAPRISNGSKTGTQFIGGTGSNGATLKDGPLPRPVTDNKTSPAVIVATKERIDIKAETVEESTIAHEIKVNGVIEHEDYGGAESSESSDIENFDGATVIDANGPVTDAPKAGSVSMIVAGSKLESNGIKFVRRRRS